MHIPKWLHRIAVIAIALAIGIAGSRYLKSRVGHDGVYPRLAATPGVDETPPKPKASLLEDERDISSALFIDSILSIVQSYYVDIDRVDNNSILLLALDALVEQNLVNLTIHGAKYTLGSGTKTYDFQIRENLSYDQLLEIMMGICSFLNQSRPESEGDLEDGDDNSYGSRVILGALLGALDAHSALLNRESYRELKQGTEGTFGGLGVLVGIRDKILTVIKPLPHSPASRNGIKQHDRILAINGVETFGYSLDDLVDYMRGDPGTIVKLKMLPQGAVFEHEMDLKREIIRVDSVTTKEYGSDHGKFLGIKIENFSSRTSRDVLAALMKFRRRNGGKIPGVILDLRFNPGGLLDQAVQVADIFLEDGVIVSTKGRRQEIEAATRGVDETAFPLVVLINGDSASASEIVAGALQDHRRAVVVGQQSFGKGSVQTVFELPGEQALKLTIARYYTPSGRSIQNVGIVPDIRLQPVFIKDQNFNLLGSHRYRTEQFLANHLNAQRSGEKVRAEERAQEQFVGYYMSDDVNEDEEIPAEKDRDLEIGLEILAGVYRTYGSAMPAEAARSQHWLALSSENIRKRIRSWESKVDEFVSKKFSLAWNQERQSAQESLKFRVWGDLSQKLVPTSTLGLNFEIENGSSQTAERVSIFMLHDGYGIEAKEQLIGRIPGHSSKVGTFVIEIPSYCPPGEIKVDFGIAQSAKISEIPIRKIKFRVDSRSTPNLVVNASLGGETGGKVMGTIERNEHAEIVMDIENTSSIPARNLSVQLTNLSGSQVEVDSNSKSISEIAAGKHATVTFRLVAGHRIFTPELSIGASVSSKDLNRDISQKFVFRAVPERVARVSEPLGH